MILKNKELTGNKRGQFNWAKTLGWILGVLLLVLVGILLYYFFTGKAIPFFSYLPGFNETRPRINALMYRYDIATGNIAYYNGDVWIERQDLSNVVDLSATSYVQLSVLRDSLKSYYFTNSLRKQPMPSNFVASGKTYTMIGIAENRQDFGYFLVDYPDHSYKTYDTATFYWDSSITPVGLWKVDFWYSEKDLPFQAAIDKFTKEKIRPPILNVIESLPQREVPRIYQMLSTQYSNFKPDFKGWGASGTVGDHTYFWSNGGDAFFVAVSPSDSRKIDELVIVTYDRYVYSMTPSSWSGNLIDRPVLIKASTSSKPNEIYKQLFPWKDGVFGNPVQIAYHDTAVSSTKNLYTCPISGYLIDERYIAVDLSKKTSETTTCTIT